MLDNIMVCHDLRDTNQNLLYCRRHEKRLCLQGANFNEWLIFNRKGRRRFVVSCMQGTRAEDRSYPYGITKKVIPSQKNKKRIFAL